MKHPFLSLLGLILMPLSALAQDATVSSPDGRLKLDFTLRDGRPTYSITYDGQPALLESPLGFVANTGDFSQKLRLKSTYQNDHPLPLRYELDRSKQHNVSKQYNTLNVTLEGGLAYRGGFRRITNGAANDPGSFEANTTNTIDPSITLTYAIEFRVENNDVAIRYNIPNQPSRANEKTFSIRIMEEKTSFTLPGGTTTFLTPQSHAMIGWKGTKPSYEEEYRYDQPLSARSQYGHGYTFPCLFKVPTTVPSASPLASPSPTTVPEASASAPSPSPSLATSPSPSPSPSSLSVKPALNAGSPSPLWLLISETDVDSRYCGSRLSDAAMNADGSALYTLAFPMPEENAGNGTSEPSMSLPNSTPWRTITIGSSLKPIVETTIPWDFVEPRYQHRAPSSTIPVSSPSASPTTSALSSTVPSASPLASSPSSSLASSPSSSLAPSPSSSLPSSPSSPSVKPALNAGINPDFTLGKGTWSWIVWQDNSINVDDQKRYIALSKAMGFQYVLIDNWWDNNIGRQKMEDLIRYAHTQGVDVFLWYSSSGYWNDIEQGPINIMSNPIKRKQEMQWMHSLGVKGIKVDFFGGDKQETIRHYENILSDADDNGLMVIFHGCTIPRGWERMYPNYVGSEAVLASENIYFTQGAADKEAKDAATHPFIRNAIGSMEFGGCFMNRHIHKGNKGGNTRRTTDVHELATCILFQNPIQNFAITPENLWSGDPTTWPDLASVTAPATPSPSPSSPSVKPALNAGTTPDYNAPGSPAPALCMDFLREVPTTWQRTLFLDGYPGRYAVLARQATGTHAWYLAGNNATGAPLKITLTPQQLRDMGIEKGHPLALYTDNLKTREPELKQLKYNGKSLTLTMADQGGFVLIASPCEASAK